MSLEDRIKDYGERARQTLLDELERRKKENNNAGKAQWVGYDEQGNGVVKKDGEEVKVKVIGGKSLSPGQSVYVDSQNTIQVRKRKGEEESPKRKKKIRPVKSRKSIRPLILEDEEEGIVKYEYYLGTVWVVRDTVSNDYEIYSSSQGFLGHFNVENTAEDQFSPLYESLRIETYEHLEELWKYYFENVYYPWESGTAFFYIATYQPPVNVFVRTGAGRSPLYCYIVNNKLYILQLVSLNVRTFSYELECTAIEPSGFSTGYTFDVGYLDLVNMSAVSLYTIDLVTKESSYTIQPYFKEELDLSGLTEARLTPPIEGNNEVYTGIANYNVSHENFEDTIRDLLGAGHPFALCNDSLWFDNSKEDFLFGYAIPSYGNYTTNFTLDRDSLFIFSSFSSNGPSLWYNTDHNRYLVFLGAETFIHAFNIPGLVTQASDAGVSAGADLVDGYWVRMAKIAVTVGSLEFDCVLAALMNPSGLNLCETYRLLEQTWQSDVISYLEEGDNLTFAESILSRVEIWIREGLSSTQQAIVIAEPNLEVLQNPDLASYLTDFILVNNTLKPGYFEANTTDRIGFVPFLDYGYSKRPLFVGYEFFGVLETQVPTE